MNISQTIHIRDYDSIELVSKEFATFHTVELSIDNIQITFFARDKAGYDKFIKFFNNFTYQVVAANNSEDDDEEQYQGYWMGR